MRQVRINCLNYMQVKGKRLDVHGSIRTRSRAKTQAEQWEYVDAPTKIFALLADTLIEAREGAAGGEDNDSWVTDSEGDGTESVKSLRKYNVNGLGDVTQDASNLTNGHSLDSPELPTDADSDPTIDGLNLVDHICSQLKNLAHQDQSQFQLYCQKLNPTQLQVVQACF